MMETGNRKQELRITHIKCTYICRHNDDGIANSMGLNETASNKVTFLLVTGVEGDYAHGGSEDWDSISLFLLLLIFASSGLSVSPVSQSTCTPSSGISHMGSLQLHTV